MASNPPPAGHKACSKCKEVKLAATSFWKDPTKKGGYTSWCKQCFNKSSQKRKEQGPGVHVTERECSICKVRKTADEFMKDARRITGLDARCRECRRAQHAARKQRNIASGSVMWDEKECKRCHIVKPAAMFKKHAYTTSGLDSWCKACCSERRKELLAQKALVHVGDPAALDNKECMLCKHIKPLSDFAKDRQQASGYHRRCKACEKSYRAEKRKPRGQNSSDADDDYDGETTEPSPSTTPIPPALAPLPPAMQMGEYYPGLFGQETEDLLATLMSLPPPSLQSLPPPQPPTLVTQPAVLLPRASAKQPRSMGQSYPLAAGLASAVKTEPQMIGPASEPVLGTDFRRLSHELLTAGGSHGSRPGWGVISTEGACNTSTSPRASGELGTLLAAHLQPAGRQADSAQGPSGAASAVGQPSAAAQQAPTHQLPPRGPAKKSAFLTGAPEGFFDSFLQEDSLALAAGQSSLFANAPGGAMDSLLGQQGLPGVAAAPTPTPLPWGRAPLVAGWAAAAGRVRTESMGVLNSAAAGRNESLRELTDATRHETLFGMAPTFQGRVESLVGSAMRVDSPLGLGVLSPARMESLFRGVSELYPPGISADMFLAGNIFGEGGALAAGGQGGGGIGFTTTGAALGQAGGVPSAPHSGLGPSGLGLGPGGEATLRGEGPIVAGADSMRLDSFLLAEIGAMESMGVARGRQESDNSLSDAAMYTWMNAMQGQAQGPGGLGAASGLSDDGGGGRQAGAGAAGQLGGRSRLSVQAGVDKAAPGGRHSGPGPGLGGTGPAGAGQGPPAAAPASFQA